MIVITGATGAIGSEVVRQLAARGAKVRAVSRNPEKVAVPAGVEVVRGDLAEPASMVAAMTGAEAAFLVGQLGPEYLESDPALVDAARAAGVRRIVKLSAIGTGEPGGAAVSTWHVPGERAVRESGLTWTILRPSGFASNSLGWAAEIRAGRPVPNLTGIGAQPWIDPRDIAAVAVEALLSDAHAGQTYTLTGPAGLNTHEQATVIGAALGRKLQVVDVPDEVAREHLLAAGRSPEFVEAALEAQVMLRKTVDVTITDDVEKVLGRAPRTYAQWVADHIDAFRADSRSSR
ncbi:MULTISPECIES: SDR family NAD(P)-dependent oxidoreductase [unclassified Nocardia]|uniref:SDR family NAD(P)-dependent oxidoreductase n=1 Tax=unclassified Nocardia TaxID=2637762 RepID=UPI001CE42A84|nr:MULTISPECIES: SDR family NAD(P)-dependent oxidoreductase [unclassified Nocardia]